MSPHEMTTSVDHDRRVIVAGCSCGGWSGERDLQGRPNSLTRAHREHHRRAKDAEICEQSARRRATAEEWARRHGSCYDCGQPADWCQCPRPCTCAAVHQSGSGIGRNPADLYADTIPADQGALFE